MKKFLSLFLVALSFCWSSSCKKDHIVASYKTRNVIIVVVDGPRYSETWGDPTHLYVPNMVKLATKGTVSTNLYNDGATNTVNGHTALLTGFYQNINNGGLEYPQNPSLQQYWLKKNGGPASDGYLICTKDKLEVLSNCVDTEFKDLYRPLTDCGKSGLFSGYREDTTTLRRIKEILTNEHPRIVMINFKQPDAAGHSANWNNYLQGIADTDSYLGELWDYLQNNGFYKDNTTLFVTNDHGRHPDGWLDGYVSHGDGCDGCRHINLLTIGPDFKTNFIDPTRYSQVDICATAAELMGLDMPHSSGKVMTTLFKDGVSKR